jgi:hypothetical protein
LLPPLDPPYQAIPAAGHTSDSLALPPRTATRRVLSLRTSQCRRPSFPVLPTSETRLGDAMVNSDRASHGVHEIPARAAPDADRISPPPLPLSPLTSLFHSLRHPGPSRGRPFT